MKNATSSAIPSWILSTLTILTLVFLFASNAQAQKQVKVLDDDPGIDCLDYKLDAASLVDYHHQIYWKQHDCIRVHLSCNPFLFNCKLEFNEQIISDGDPLAAFGGLIKLNVSSVTGSGGTTSDSAKDNTIAAKALEQPSAVATNEFKNELEVAIAADPKNQDLLKAENAFFDYKAEIAQGPATEGEPLRVSPFVDLYSLQQRENKLDSIKAQISGMKVGDKDSKHKQLKATLENGVDKMKNALKNPSPLPPGKVDSWGTNDVPRLEAEAKTIAATLTAKTKIYTDFSASVPDTLSELRSPSDPVNSIRTKAKELRKNATNVLNQLSDNNPSAASASATAESSIYEGQMLAFAHDAALLHSDLVDAKISGGAPVGKLLDRLHSAGEGVALSACTYKAELDNDFNTLRTGLLDPLNKVLDDPTAFEFEKYAVKREGPWSDPEQVTMSLHRDEVSPFNSSPDDPNKPANTTSSFSCSRDASDLFDNGATYKKFDDFFSDKEVRNAPNAAANTYTRNQLKPVPVPKGADVSAKDKKPATPDPNANVVLVQPWFFGKARLVVTGGLTTGFLSKQEFQRSSSITGTTSQTVIGLKTDTRYRLTPMLFAHTLLYSKRHDSDAWYATLGVTASSDTKGTSPEFLLGFSRSLAQQRFFVTLGSYIGERQKLDGGLQVGQVIPATLTGELPVTKSYHAGWGFGISYRFTSTKDPQKNAATAKPASGTAK